MTSTPDPRSGASPADRGFDADDPRLTAYVLGELDEAERADIEQLLETSPAAREYVESLRDLAGQLEIELQQEPAVGLTVDQRSQVEQSAQPATATAHKPTRQRWGRSALMATLATVSAAVLIGVFVNGGTFFRSLTPDHTRAVALQSEPTSDLAALESSKQTNTGYVAQSERTVALESRSLIEGMSLVNEKRESAEQPQERFIAPDSNSNGAIRESLGVSGQSPPGVAGPPLKKSGNSKSPVLALMDESRVDHNGDKGNAPAAPVASPTPAPVDSRPPSRVTRPEALERKEQSQGVSSGEVTGELGVRFRNPMTNRETRLPDSGAFPAETRAKTTTFASEDYEGIIENPFLSPFDQPLSTFSIDVDTASYSNVRRFLQHNHWPPRDAVRIEELVNYFDYNDPPPGTNVPFSAKLEVAPCPWNVENRLVRIGLKGKEITREERPPCNLVFLIDVSGSMSPENKLPLVKRSLLMLAEELREGDQIAIVTYAGSSGLLLDSTSGEQQETIRNAINSLNAAGSTNGASGIQLAYETAVRHFIDKGTNRVILCTDGDFNVGITSDEALVELIQEKARTGVFLSVFGFGMGNLKDAKLEKLADKGNGQYGYIDSLREAQKVFVEGLSGTLITIAKDVKIQIEFNPARVGAYRLIGYENRKLADRDFDDDTKDAGEIGAGHSVTALYEIQPPEKAAAVRERAGLKYQARAETEVKDEHSRELLTLKLRYKQPDGNESALLEFPAVEPTEGSRPSPDFQWAAAVAGFGMVLRDSPFRGQASLNLVEELAQGAKGEDKFGRRGEFLELVRKAKQLRGEQTP